MRRTHVSALVLVIWFAMIGWQVRREYFQPELTRLAEAALSLAPGVNFYTLRLGDRTVGLATSRLDTVPSGFELEDVMTLDLPALGQTGSAVVRTRVSLSHALVMGYFFFSLDSEVGRFRAEGVLGADSTLHVTIDAGGSEQEVAYRFAEPPIFSAALPIRIAMAGELKVGNTLHLPVFDPSTLSMRVVEIRVLEHHTLIVADSSSYNAATTRWSPSRYDSVPAWKIAEVYGGVQVESWVDEDGRVLSATSALGFTMEKTEYELARQAREDASGQLSLAIDEDVILSTAVRSNVDQSPVPH